MSRAAARLGRALPGPCLAAFLAAACSDDPVEQYAPLSAACDQCLSQNEATGCRAEWQACVTESACEDNVLCALRARCYAERADSSCVADAGCELASDASEAAAANSASFEACARSSCAESCDFVAP